MSYGIGFLVALGLFGLGYYIGATEYAGAFTGVLWTDIGTLFVTFFGFVFGFLTYFQWQSSKRREDAYSAAKQYVATLDEVDDHLGELQLLYNHMCPAKGEAVAKESVSGKRVEHLNTMWNYLYQSRQALYKAHRELEFWHVKLIGGFTDDYRNTIGLLNSMSVTCAALNNQLYHYIHSEMENIDQVIQLKEQFDELYDQIQKISQRRVQSGFKAMFRFSN